MSRRPDLSDADLRDLIRRSMEHYRMDRSLPTAGRRPRPSWRRIALPVSAVVAGGVAAIVAIGVLQPFGGPRPSIDRGALEVCRPEQRPRQIPDDWLDPGETRAAIIDALRHLPLAARHEDRGLTIYLFSDGRFGASCVTLGNDPGSLGPSVRHARTMHLDEAGGVVRIAGGSTGPEGPVIASGTAAEGVERVELIRSDGERIPAILAGGVWVAWWPERVGGTSVEAFDAQGRLLGRHEESITVPPPAPPFSDEVAREGCLNDHVIPEEWRLPGEDFDEAQERVRSLPLLIAHHAAHQSTFLFGDETYWIHCTLDRLAAGQSASSGPRSDEDGPVIVRSGGSPNPWDLPESVIAGEAAATAARVTVELRDGSIIDAQLAGGYWLASWESFAEARTVRAYDSDGNELGSTSVPGR